MKHLGTFNVVLSRMSVLMVLLCTFLLSFLFLVLGCARSRSLRRLFSSGAERGLVTQCAGCSLQWLLVAAHGLSSARASVDGALGSRAQA